jgi:hypothetical protein
MFNPSFVHKRFVVVLTCGRIPDFGRFYGSRGSHVVEAALAKNLPHRSRENEFSAGRVGRVKDGIVLYELNEFRRVLTSSRTSREE